MTENKRRESIVGTEVCCEGDGSTAVRESAQRSVFFPAVRDKYSVALMIYYVDIEPSRHV